MGFATSVTVVIFFVAILIITSIAYPTLINSYRTIQDSQDDKHEIRMDQLNTAIDVKSIIDWNPNNITITISNTGTTVLDVNNMEILVDGLYTAYSAAPTGYWIPGTDVQFKVTASTTTNHQIMIITENGNSDTVIFYS